MGKSWKAFELRIAKRLGGKRIPVTGERAGADVKAGHFRIQAKLGYHEPGYLRKWLQGIVGSADLEEKSTGTALLGMVVWKPKGVADDEALVVLRLRDFTDWFGGNDESDAGGTDPVERPEASH